MTSGRRFALHSAFGRLSILAILLGLSWTQAGRAEPPRTPVARARTRHSAGLSRYDSLTIAQDRLTAASVLDSLDEIARREGDRGLAVLVAERRTRRLAELGRLDEAERSARFVLDYAVPGRDTLMLARSLVDLGDIQRKRLANRDAAASFRRAIRVADRAGIASTGATARLRLGYLYLYEGRAEAARRQFEAALRISRSARDDFRVVRAQSGLARALHVAGRYEEARGAYRLVLEGAMRRGEKAEQADTYSALGILETTYGDPDAAVDEFARGLELHRALRVIDGAAGDATHIAEHDLWRGAPTHADSVLSSVLPEARALPARQVYAGLLVTLAHVRHLQGRDHDAESLVRRSLAMADSIQPLFAAELVANGIGALLAARRYEASRALCDSHLVRLEARMPHAGLAPLEFLRAVALNRAGRAREALPLLRAAIEAPGIESGTLNGSRVARCAELARCYRALGRVDSALAWYRAATDAWERGRATASRDDSRAMSDNIAGAFSGGYLLALLDPARGSSAPARAAAAFAALQRFRAHTLTEQMRGPGHSRATGVHDLASLQRGILGPGEVVLELHATPDTTVLFAITRTDVRTWFAPREAALRARLARFRDLLADPRGDRGDRWQVVARALGEELLGPAADLLAGAPRVYVSAGAMARYPLGSVILPGAREVLASEREVAFVPAAAMIGLARAQEPAISRPGVTALARTVGEAGRPLPGAAAEVRDLSRRFANVVALVDPPLGAARIARERLADAEILHFATHTYVDEQQPWRSGLLVGDPAGGDAYLRSAAIAGLRVRARLCVLSSCRGIGSVGSVEGVPLQGLAPAWLAAGARSLVAALWDVDDVATVRLMRRFYDGLARGRGVAAALSAAQREIRSQSEYAAPYYWAGFVVLGDPTTRVTLTPRR